MAAHSHGALSAASFEEWDAASYLMDYYSRVEPEERHTLSFLTRELRKISGASTALEFGIGPTLHHALPLAPHVDEIHVADLRHDNLEAVRQWQHQAPAAHDWSDFTREVLICEGHRNPTRKDILEREAITRRRLKRRIIGDARLRHPLGPAHLHRYECVVSCYCADSATDNVHDWFVYLRNIVSLLAPGGFLAIAALRNCHFYDVAGRRFPSAGIDERHMRFAFAALGFDMSSAVVQVEHTPERLHCGFGSIVLASGFLGHGRANRATASASACVRNRSQHSPRHTSRPAWRGAP